MEKFGNKNLNSLEFIEKINEGSYGIVFKGYIKSQESKKIVAIKKIKKKYPDEVIDHNSLREITILKELKHPNIICLLDIIIDNDELFLIYEYLDMDLNKFIYKAKSYITKTLLKEIIFKILKGLEYLHGKFIIHRDLKPKNILISNDGQIVKIADFGLSRKLNIFNQNYSKKIGTIYYMAPEILLNFSDYSYNIDVWSVACIFYEIAFKKRLFSGNNYTEQLQQIAIILGTPTNDNWVNIEACDNYNHIYPKRFIKGIFDDKVKGLSNKAIDLLKRMLIYNPNKRINVKNALSHVSYIIL